MYNFLCSDSLLYFFLFLSTLHSVYTRDCSCSKTSISINIYMQKAGEPENDAGFPKHNYSQLNCSCYSYPSKQFFLGCTSMVSLSGYTLKVRPH